MTTMPDLFTDLPTTDTELGDSFALARRTAGLRGVAVVDLMRAHGLRWAGNTVTDVETGDRPLRLREALILAQALDLSLEELVHYRALHGARLAAEAEEKAKRDARRQALLAELAELDAQ